MNPEMNSPPPTELAHTLFIDIVGWSLLPGEDQAWYVDQLNLAVRATPEFAVAESSQKFLRHSTGDGIWIAFQGDPQDPVKCALGIVRNLRRIPEIKLRMGIHTGPIYRVQDINALQNIAGNGINMAQRVMDCGDGGHILLSASFANILMQVPSWQGMLHDLGECEVKHGVKVQIYNFYTENAGNSERPKKLQTQAVVNAPAVPMWSTDIAQTASIMQPAPALARRIALLYKRHAHPDEYVMHLLEAQLTANGHTVFVDRHLVPGVEWGREIEREVREADVVICLLSAAAIPSEMLSYEIQIAHETRQRNGGRPRLIPIRVNYEGALPESLAAILDPLEYASWWGPQDDSRLVSAIEEALSNRTSSNGLMPPPTVHQAPPPDLEPVGGAVPLNSRFYITRNSDQEFLTALARQDSIVLVKGARQMGKTSLLARGLQQARGSHAKVVKTDFQKLNTSDIASTEALFLALGQSIADQLDLEVMPDEVWDARRRSPNANFERYLRREVMRKIDGPLIWAMDEVDRLFNCDFANDVFGLFRSWHNDRANELDCPWNNLTLAIAYATEAHLFIRDLNQSPFNVGTRVLLEDFTREQVQDLNARHGLPLKETGEVERFYSMVGGHPYLVRRGLYVMASQKMDIGAFEASVDRDNGPVGDHLRRILVSLATDAEMCAAVREVLRGEPCPTLESFYGLTRAGLIVGDSPRDCHLRCRLYTQYLSRHLL